MSSQHDEHTLLQAHQTLVGPKTRLEAELSWFPDLPPTRARELVELLESEPELGKVAEALEGVAALAAANVFATLCSRLPGEKILVMGLITGCANVSVEEVVKVIDESRSVSGFPKTDRTLVDEILGRIMEAHARTAVQSISNFEHPGNLMTEIVETYLSSPGRLVLPH